MFDKQREERFSRLNAWKVCRDKINVIKVEHGYAQAEKKHQQMESERLKEIKDTEDAKKRERESKQRVLYRSHLGGV